MGRFNGWPEQAFDILLQLEGDPTREERELLRKERERLVRQPMIALLQDIADADPAYDEFFVWGFGKMVWPWQRQAGVIRVAGAHEHGVTFDLDGLWVTGNWANRKLPEFRAAVAADKTGKELERILKALRAKGYELSADIMQRTPRGFSSDHARDELLRHRSLSATKPLGCDDWLHTKEAVDHVLGGLAELRPLMRWLAAHVPSD